jgi:hypothetical protein
VSDDVWRVSFPAIGLLIKFTQNLTIFARTDVAAVLPGWQLALFAQPTQLALKLKIERGHLFFVSPFFMLKGLLGGSLPVRIGRYRAIQSLVALAFGGYD